MRRPAFKVHLLPRRPLFVPKPVPCSVPLANVQRLPEWQVSTGSEHFGPFSVHDLDSQHICRRARELQDAALAWQHPVSAHDAASSGYDFTPELVYLKRFELVARPGSHIFWLYRATGDRRVHECGFMASVLHV